MKSRGFTLVEVMVVITISVILVAMALPSFRTMIRSNEISSATNTLVAGLDLARSEAIRRNTVVTMCRSVDAATPNPNCSNAVSGNFANNDWAVGWVVFAKAPGNAVNTAIEAGDEIILRQAPFQNAAVERLIVGSSLANPQRWSFGPNGLRIANANDVEFIVDYRDPQVVQPTALGRCMVANLTGRGRVHRLVNGVCPGE
jgi:prepilin-type N-terminal cleavage/methylation domain-containing protein